MIKILWTVRGQKKRRGSRISSKHPPLLTSWGACSRLAIQIWEHADSWPSTPQGVAEPATTGERQANTGKQVIYPASNIAYYVNRNNQYQPFLAAKSRFGDKAMRRSSRGQPATAAAAATVRYHEVTESVFYATLNHTEPHMVKLFTHKIVQKCSQPSKGQKFQCLPHYDTQLNSSKSAQLLFFSSKSST